MAERDPQIASRRNYPGYDEDFAAWLKAQALLIRDGRFAEIDAENLAEEVDGVARSDFRAFTSALYLIIFHMLKWDYQVERQGRSWRDTIRTQRRAALKILEDSPSYKARIAEAIEDAYRGVPDDIDAATGVPANRLPATCPYNWDEIMNRLHDLDPDRPWPNWPSHSERPA